LRKQLKTVLVFSRL